MLLKLNILVVIYVIGGCRKAVSLDIEVLDVKTQTWECFPGLCKEEVSERTIESLVMNEKIYIMTHRQTFVYDPKTYCWGKIRIYDPEAKSWTFMKGAEDLPKMVNYYAGYKMAIMAENLRFCTLIVMSIATQRFGTRRLHWKSEKEKRFGGKSCGLIM
ncbi:unnamed protein product [Microthlaspi erraticum]|uniref:F-box associated domain-containing protein n=1 Tax=Microthlaspi erraticum TaxID=1685480 RepID=A0A6D2K064_9BRAS|nr:unnamed protein product [Microthlaspi erraticum]